MLGMLRRLFGTRGERAAEKFLQKKGLRVVARQFNTRWGEIDLIALDGDTVVFVEVKTRASEATGSPSERVDQTKREHSTKAALAYLKQKRLLGHRARFDVVTVVWPKDSATPTITHFEHAFEAVDIGQIY